VTESEPTKVLRLDGRGDVSTIFIQACNLIRSVDGPAQSSSFAYQFGFLEGANGRHADGRGITGPEYKPLFVEAAKGVGWIVEWKE
jgi:hypothetical protein